MISCELHAASQVFKCPLCQHQICFILKQNLEGHSTKVQTGSLPFHEVFSWKMSSCQSLLADDTLRLLNLRTHGCQAPTANTQSTSQHGKVAGSQILEEMHFKVSNFHMPQNNQSEIGNLTWSTHVNGMLRVLKRNMTGEIPVVALPLLATDWHSKTNCVWRNAFSKWSLQQTVFVWFSWWRGAQVWAWGYRMTKEWRILAIDSDWFRVDGQTHWCSYLCKLRVTCTTVHREFSQGSVNSCQ